MTHSLGSNFSPGHDAIMFIYGAVAAAYVCKMFWSFFTQLQPKSTFAQWQVSWFVICRWSHFMINDLKEGKREQESGWVLMMIPAHQLAFYWRGRDWRICKGIIQFPSNHVCSVSILLLMRMRCFYMFLFKDAVVSDELVSKWYTKNFIEWVVRTCLISNLGFS